MKDTVKKVLYFGLIALLAGVFLYSAWQLGSYAVASIQAKNAYNDLSSLRGEHAPSRPPIAQTEASVPEGNIEILTPTQTESPYVTITDPATGLEMEILPEFAELYQRNQDLVGWIEIPGTQVSYPVVQTPDRPDYYLRRDFNGKYATHGCIYVREQCDVNKPSDNLTIYGHRMQDGTMFKELLNYASKEYFEEHRYIYFDTLTQRQTYEVIATFRTTATLGEGFSYHLFVDAEDENAFDKYVDQCKRLGFFDTGVEALYGDKLISLSTCDYALENGRMVVVAKRVG